MPLKYLVHSVESDMGDTYARMTVYGPLGRDTVEALVDTGATFTNISSATAEKVGIDRRD